jgi:hypothetical protein
LFQWGDTSWRARPSMSEDLVCYHINFFTCCCSSMSWSCITFPPSGIPHIAAFVTLYEAYMGIEPHFNLWNYFFRARLWPGSDVEAEVWGSVDIIVHSRLGANPYFYFSISGPMVEWQKVWFFLRKKPTHRSPCSWVAALPLNLNGGTVWLSNTSACYNLCATSSGSC